MKIVTILNGEVSPGAEGITLDKSNKKINVNYFIKINLDLKVGDDLSNLLVIKYDHTKPNVRFYSSCGKNSKKLDRVKITAAIWSKNEVVFILKPHGKFKIIEKNSNGGKIITVWQWDGKVLESSVNGNTLQSINIVELVKEVEIE